MTKVAVLLAGCGVNDGSEIHEATLTLLHLARAGAEVVAVAPDKAQLDVVDHAQGAPAGEARNVLVESARISRGEITPLDRLDVDAVDAVIIPGGFGAAKNLCDFAVKGADCTVDPEVERVVRAAHAAGKPVGAWCIAPAILAAVFRGTETHPRITIGNDPGTASVLESMGARHEACEVGGFVVDEEHRLVTTPAYMLGPTIADVDRGIAGAVEAVLRLAG